MDDINITKSIVRDQLNDFIKATWETIGNYQASITNLQTLENHDELIPIIEDIINDNMIHVGQLQKALEMIVPDVINKIKEGEEEAAATLGESEVEEQLQEAMYTDTVPRYAHIASVGLFSTGCAPEEYEKEAEVGHYEIDLDSEVFTRVKDRRYLGNYLIETFPRETMEEVERTAKNIMAKGNFKEVSNKEYLKLQKEWAEVKARF